MYAIAYKQAARTSWRMEQKVYDDREKADVRKRYLKGAMHSVVIVFFDAPID